MAQGFGELTARERRIYEAGGAASAEKPAQQPASDRDIIGQGWLSAEFAITVVTTVFAMWVGYRLIIDPTLDMNRALAAVGAVMGVAWFYLTKRTELKKAATEAGTTTIKAPAGTAADVLALPRNGGSR